MSANETVIDNENIILVDQLKDLLPDANRASIAVGYFFISGFGAIMDSLKKIENSKDPTHVVRLLISPTTNRATAEALLASNEAYDTVRIHSKQSDSEEKGKEAAKKEIKKTLEYMPQTPKDQRAVKKFIELIQKKRSKSKYTQRNSYTQRHTSLSWITNTCQKWQLLVQAIFQYLESKSILN